MRWLRLVRVSVRVRPNPDTNPDPSPDPDPNQAARQCLAICARCPRCELHLLTSTLTMTLTLTLALAPTLTRCEHISVSLPLQDCSWFATCPAQLQVLPDQPDVCHTGLEP